MSEHCPECGWEGDAAIVQYDPAPNDAQKQSDDIPTESMQVVAGVVCKGCGELLRALVAQGEVEP